MVLTPHLNHIALWVSNWCLPIKRIRPRLTRNLVWCMRSIVWTVLIFILDKLATSLVRELKEHKSLAPRRKLSAVAEHFSTTGRTIDWENTKVLDRKDREYPCQVREAIYIEKKKPSLNRDQGLELPSLYSGLLWLTSSRTLGGQ